MVSVPAFGWMSRYDGATLRADVVAGLTAGAIVIPKAMAYATIADIPLQAGLYTAFLPMIVYAVLGTSNVLSVSTTTTIAILGGAAIGGSGADPATATATLAMLVGAILLLARVLRLGFLANFISDPVLTGFKAGIGLVIVIDQLPKLLGIKIAKENFFADVASIVEKVPQAKVATVAVAVATFAVIIVVEKFFRRAPAPLIAIGGGIAASALLGLGAMGVSVVGEIPGGFPKLTPADAVLAAVVIAYSIGLIDPAELRAIRSIRTLEFRWALAAALGVLLLGTLKGILVAVLLSLASLVALANNPRVDMLARKPGTNVFRARSGEHAGDESYPGLAIVKTEGRMYFANAPVVAERIRELVDREKPRVLAIDCSAIPGFEFTALNMLNQAEEQLRREGVELWLVALNPEALEMVRRTPLAERLGRGRMRVNLEDAVDAYLARTT